MKGIKYSTVCLACLFLLSPLLSSLQDSPARLQKVKESLEQFKQYEQDIKQVREDIEGLSKRLLDLLKTQGKNDLAREVEQLKEELLSIHESDRKQYEETFEAMMEEVDTEQDRLDLEILLLQQKITMDIEFLERIKKLAEEKSKGVQLGSGGELLAIEAGYKLFNIESMLSGYKTKVENTIQLYKSLSSESENPPSRTEVVSPPIKKATPPTAHVAPQPPVTPRQGKTPPPEKQSGRQKTPPAEGVVFYRGLAVDMWNGEHRVVRVNDTFRGEGTVHTILESSATLALDTKNGTCSGQVRYVYRAVYDDPSSAPDVTTIERELRGTFDAKRYLRGPLNGVWLISSLRNMATMDRVSGMVFKSSNVYVNNVPELHGDFILLYLAQRSTPLANQTFFQQLRDHGDLSPNYNSEQPVAILWLDSQR